QSVQSTSGSQPEPLVVSIYSSLTGVLAKELSIGFSGEYTINAGDLPAGYYLVKVSRNSDVVYSKQIRIQ
ncbi:MAG: T9SS type A sorting domain-containing protein, partial [Dysgonamonadaceae bacterium]|nr:T9SS type A sorting domain-containing protein [Dysgonamonadaceae bacterium]